MVWQCRVNNKIIRNKDEARKLCGTQPREKERVCQLSRPNCKVRYDWKIRSPWSECSVSCGTEGIESRDVVCWDVSDASLSLDDPLRVRKNINNNWYSAQTSHGHWRGPMHGPHPKTVRDTTVREAQMSTDMARQWLARVRTKHGQVRHGLQLSRGRVHTRQPCYHGSVLRFNVSDILRVLKC